ncbi:glucose-6-phosphate isomerase [Acetobacterium paludosum]|uniref:Glucose-6-phosphate isomerase n=1 Tax=Acetobacterium paludosum TaxID=52693 RepID=A0A923KWB0_9FIRM|nr:glucose-6-phosphate isomerase [Acetobacterium paludosum]MBC3888275.1 glucose-6-phosphate isomerase [Acetobacterium paludosum]
MSIHFDLSYANIKLSELKNRFDELSLANEKLMKKTGIGNDFLGWVDYPVQYDEREFSRIKQAAKKIQENCDALVVIGIGGSYLGAKAVISALTSPFYNEEPRVKRNAPKIYFAGQNISGKYIENLLALLEDQDVCVNVVSKSGTTTESAIAFRFFKEFLERKYGKDGAKDRIFITTDASKGALKFMATKEGYECFVIPDDIGGRYSVFTAVGLLPIAAAGIDIDAFIAGEKEGYEDYQNPNFDDNPCFQYALYRNVLYNSGKNIEILVDYDPSLEYISEWWKQLFGESDGKDGKGLFPVAVHFSTDLHSMGQMIQDGPKNHFETVLVIDEEQSEIKVLHDDADLEGLNYLAGKKIDAINEKAFKGTLLAHVDGGVPNGIIHLKKLDAFTLGKLIYFFEKACGLDGYLLGVNPFNQPGVEAYKKNMFALLHKPGYEALTTELEERL